MEKLIIYGNGKIAKVIYQYLKDIYDVACFCVESEFITSKSLFDIPVLSYERVKKNYPPNAYKLIVCVGYIEMNRVRERIYNDGKAFGYKFINYIHPSVHIHSDLIIGENNIVLDGVSIQPGVQIGNSNYIWSNSTIAHGSKVINSNWITSGVVISGDAVVSSCCFIGVNATIGHNCIIANETFIGANSLITRNTAESDVYLIKDSIKFKLDSQRFMKFSGV